jgi:hypothetical protein
MQYKFEKEKNNYEFLASGNVLKSVPGNPAFPVRLASEIFQRGLSFIKKPIENLTIYDPCCGSAYLLTVLGILHRGKIETIIGSDIDEDVIEIAEKNISLISENGIQNRINELIIKRDNYKKKSHTNALVSANKIKEIISDGNHKFNYDVFRVNALIRSLKVPVFNNIRIDIIISDLPYSNQTSWIGINEDVLESPEHLLLENLISIASRDTVIIICTKKIVVVQHPKFIILKKEKIGKRKITFLKLS